jgi:hypothetical protein
MLGELRQFQPGLKARTGAFKSDFDLIDELVGDLKISDDLFYSQSKTF